MTPRTVPFPPVMSLCADGWRTVSAFAPSKHPAPTVPGGNGNANARISTAPCRSFVAWERRNLLPHCCALPQLRGLGAPEFVATLPALQTVCGARFTRHSCTIDLGDALVELALDQGVLLGGNREIPLCEVEAELKAGSRKAVVQFAAALAARFGMQPEPHSKFRRASALAEGESL